MISIIVPIYNVEKYLRRCIDSILGQTCRNFEVILVDDGSPDGCGAICDAYAAKDARVTVIHQQNAGVSAARNVGLVYARGELIGFVDPDDFIAPSMYQEMLDAINATGAELAVCGYNYVDDDGEVDYCLQYAWHWTSDLSAAGAALPDVHEGGFHGDNAGLI